MPLVTNNLPSVGHNVIQAIHENFDGRCVMRTTMVVALLLVGCSGPGDSMDMEEVHADLSRTADLSRPGDLGVITDLGAYLNPQCGNPGQACCDDYTCNPGGVCMAAPTVIPPTEKVRIGLPNESTNSPIFPPWYCSGGSATP